MKKFCAFVCLFTLLLAAPAFAAKTGFDIHEGAFGPEINGLQLGMPMTLTQAKQTMEDTFSFSEFTIVISGINGFSDSESDLKLVYRKDKDGIIHYEIEDEGAYESFEQYNNDSEIFAEVEKRGYGVAYIYEGDYYLDTEVWINISHDRVSLFSFDRSVFGVSYMSYEEFIQELRKAYPLPPLEKGERGYYGGCNRSEGWRVDIGNGRVYNRIIISTIDIPDND